jgi:hypothetical protein
MPYIARFIKGGCAMSGSYTRLISAWVRETEYRYVHRSGACIERRGFPGVPGWYIIPDAGARTPERFEPTPQGFDDAFVAFSARYDA